MPVQVNQNSNAPPSASAPDGTAAFPLVFTVSGGVITLSQSGYPNGATPLSNSSGNQAAATATATLTPSATKTAFLSGFEWTGGGATAAAVAVLTITGVIGGTVSYPILAPLGAGVPNNLVVPLTPPLQATAVNTPIVVSIPSLGTGNLASGVVAHGYMI